MTSIKKINLEKQRIVEQCKKCDGKGCSSCLSYCYYIDRMAEAAIPVDYWFRDFKEFYGDPDFKSYIVDGYIKQLKQRYLEGFSLCLVGHPGTGKTMAACSVLKAAVLPNKTDPNYFSSYYITLTDAISQLTSSESYFLRNIIREYDFMVVDEVDQRFFQSQASEELYASQLESILRTRTQNKLPTIICSNSEDPNQIFSGNFKYIFESILSQFFKVLRPGGKDARKNKERL